ncbi:CatB-related O-acetyltransferase [Pseudomonas huanghezhanensis]|uniref:CatB-related O-acetyltransferase n=1 Tax=Pseudomonas huanghezhanensis TaxID=3002903 RepID=UPI0038B445C4
MLGLKRLQWKRRIRNHGCKIGGGLKSLASQTELVLEENVLLGRVDIESKKLILGAHTYIRSGGQLSCVASIGRFCSISSDVVIGQSRNTHPTNWVSSHPFQYTDSQTHYVSQRSSTIVGHDVWIGRGAMLFDGVSVGTGAIIAAQSVVTQNVPAYAVVAGVPAKVVRFRHPPALITRLLKSRWWELEVTDLKRLPMDNPETFLDRLDQSACRPARYSKLFVTRTGCYANGDFTHVYPVREIRCAP